MEGDLAEEHLARAEQLAKAGRNRGVVRALCRLRGEWRLEQQQWEAAAEYLHEAVRMAREIGYPDILAEAQLACARLHLKEVVDLSPVFEQLSRGEGSALRAGAELSFAGGDYETAKSKAIEAYRWAWGEGEPYVYRYELRKARGLLERLGIEIPVLEPYDCGGDGKLPFEDAVATALERARAEVDLKP